MKRRRSAAQRAKDGEVIADITRRVNAAVDTFERRWPMMSLALVDVELHDKLAEQIDWFREASITNDNPTIAVEEGEAALRGIAAATAAMEPETDHLVSWSDAIGGNLVIAHGFDIPGGEIDLDNDVVITPAEIVDWLKAHPALLEAKRIFPGCVFRHRHKQNGGEDHEVEVDIYQQGREVNEA